MRTFCLTFCLTLLAAGAWAQSQIQFQNDATSLIYTNSLSIGGSRGLTAPLPDGFYYGLFAAPGGTTDPNAFTFSGLYATNTALAGRYNGGNDLLPVWVPGVSIAYLVRGWSSNLGRDWGVISSQAQSGTWSEQGFYGTSPIANATYPQPPTPPPTLTFPGFDLFSVPEPTTMGLLVLGTVVAIIRRRKQMSCKA